MAQGVDIGMVRQHYAGVSDQELIRIITDDGLLLTSEAKEVVLHEVQKRRLQPDLLPFVNAQQKVYSETEIDALCELLRTLSCPICKQSDQLLNMTHIMSVVSFILMTNVNRSSLIACPDCLNKAMRKATITTSLFGWWGLPWGIIRTIQALSNNTAYRRAHHTHFPNEALRSYVAAHAGMISVSRNDSRQLKKLVFAVNKQTTEEV